MQLLRLAFRNTLRHPLRSILTALGVAVALFAFTMIQTLIGAWYAGVENSAKNRLIVRNSVSLVFSLPGTYGTAISKVPGVSLVGHGNWFGGIYKDESFRFQQFAVDENYLGVYPELNVAPDDRAAWEKERRGALVGKQISETYGIKKGDVIQLKGTIFPGLWEFVVNGVFTGREADSDTRLMIFHYDYLNERNKAEMNREPDNVGFYVVQLQPGANPAGVSKAIDAQFANSYAETLTETETAFVQGFVSMSSTIISTLRVVAFVVIVIMLLVLANTALMSLRERYREYSILKSLGFEPQSLVILIVGEVAILVGGGLVILGVMLTPFFMMSTQELLGGLSNFFPVFAISSGTLALVLVFAVAVTALASAIPIATMSKLRIVDGLRQLS